MTASFFTAPIINSPYEYPTHHWELDAASQPTGTTLPGRRPASFVTPVRAPRKQGRGQKELALGELSSEGQHEEAWQSLHSDTSRPFERPKSGRIAVKVINHLGDEVMKVFRV